MRILVLSVLSSLFLVPAAAWGQAPPDSPPPVPSPPPDLSVAPPEPPKPPAAAVVAPKPSSMTARWDHGAWLETADKAFRIHVGGRTQFDAVGSWSDDNVRAASPGGIGPFNDAVNFRRARLEIDGWLFGVVDFFFEYDFLNTFDSGKMVDPQDDFGGRTLNTPVPTDLWMSVNHIPFIRTLRAGNMKPPIGFEHLTSSRFLGLLERSYQFDAFIENGDNGFAPGIQLLDWTEDQRLTFQIGVFSNSRSIFGWNVGNDEWQYVGRVTGLPWYEEGGRFMLHLGVGASYDGLDDGNTRYRARPLLRNGPAALHNIVAVARLDADHQVRVNPELFVNLGPLSLQTEYTAVWVSDVTRILQTPTQSNVVLSPTGFFAHGVYAEAQYFLTGEHRQYGKTGLHGSGAATGRVTPRHNVGWGEHASASGGGIGAWQLGARYSYLDLTDGAILGGRLHDVTAGLSWYLNPNFKIQANYSHGWRRIAGSTASGSFQQAGVTFRADI